LRGRVSSGQLVGVRRRNQETTYLATRPITIAHRSTKLNVTDTPIKIKTKPTCKAVIFDLDGVITSTDDDHYRAWKAIADKSGLAFDRTINQELRGVSRTESLKIILKHNKRTLADDEIKKLCDEKNEIYRSFLTELTPKDILPNIEALLKQLKEKNMRIGLASASRNARTILSNLKLTHYFDVIVDAKDLIRPKPDPEIFARVADALGFYPEECTGVEDAKAGIEAINASMMKAVGIGDAVDPDECDVHRKDTRTLTIEDLLF
jgi:beta-phosphoglucomutase